MVRDIEKSLVFYQELTELKVIRQLKLETGNIVFLANTKGETMLELIAFEQAEKIFTKGMVMSFSTNQNLEAVRKKALDLGYVPSNIIEEGPKPKHFKVADPDGVIVEFCME